MTWQEHESPLTFPPTGLHYLEFRKRNKNRIRLNSCQYQCFNSPEPLYV